MKMQEANAQRVTNEHRIDSKSRYTQPVRRSKKEGETSILKVEADKKFKR